MFLVFQETTKVSYKTLRLERSNLAVMEFNGFPFVIDVEFVPHIATKVFGSLAQCDTDTLLKLRSVSIGWKKCVDTQTMLWNRMSLLRAVKDGRTDIAQLIIQNADNKNPPDHYGWTPLHRAADEGHTEICRLIIENVEDKNPPNQYGLTPLHRAANKGHIEICRLIIENVEDKNPPDHYGETPLDLAAREGHTDICRLIKEKD